ncbi:calpain family cysteine protease containing protein [Stylonychia lemnae]|uniref:Calpain family cysteine protease containing protein n=1 Tax=Stylonychia lemnae TaxID=5949 RepID=A0A078B2D4_STYLE|nr:calpain family cysteine protease containing protein [Stylonychia lemnae]|eukprot:CDW87377.1 calpain family cysteine protease containing protein [Stylonychia lemnae]
MRLTLAIALLFIGATSALSKSRIQKFIHSLPQMQQTNQLQQTCSANINRLKNELANPTNYKSLVQNSDNFWNDTTFPADSTSIQWSGSFNQNKISQYLNTKWARLNNLCQNCTMYGTSDYLNDIDQNSLGDCYYLAGIAALAEVNSRFEKAFVNPEVNWAGIYAFNVYIRGIPHVIVVDDAVPTGTTLKKPIFAGFGLDGAMWGPLLEKAWAKTNVNYEQIEGGQAFEAFDFLSNAPHQYIIINATILSKEATWAKILDADNRNFIMSLSTPSSPGGDQDTCNFGIACGHAYSLLSVKTLENADRTSSTRIFQIRNPWRSESKFNGSFQDGSSLWFTPGPNGKTWGQQVNLVVSNDGIFYMTLDEVMDSFRGLNIYEWRENFVASWYDKRDDQVANKTTPSIYKFTLNEPTPLQIRVLPYPSRMYPATCKNKLALIKLNLLDSKGKTVNQLYYYETLYSYISLIDTPLAAGNYTLQFYVEWDVNDIRDYGIIINSPKDIAILDVNNQTSRPTSHDFSSKDLKPLVAQVSKPPKPQVPSCAKTSPAYNMTGNLTADLAGLRYSESFTIKNTNGNFLSGSQAALIGKRYEIVFFQGTQTEEYTYNATVSITTKPGYSYIYTPGNDKCFSTKNQTSGQETLQCNCNIAYDYYPKECMLALLTSENAGYKTSQAWGLTVPV